MYHNPIVSLPFCQQKTLKNYYKRIYSTFISRVKGSEIKFQSGSFPEQRESRSYIAIPENIKKIPPGLSLPSRTFDSYK
jgi:hypothetical protein